MAIRSISGWPFFILYFSFKVPSLLVINTCGLRLAYVKTRKQDVSRMCETNVLMGEGEQEITLQISECKYSIFQCKMQDLALIFLWYVILTIANVSEETQVECCLAKYEHRSATVTGITLNLFSHIPYKEETHGDSC